MQWIKTTDSALHSVDLKPTLETKNEQLCILKVQASKHRNFSSVRSDWGLIHWLCIKLLGIARWNSCKRIGSWFYRR